MRPRDSDAFAEIAFAGLELVPPGIVLVSEWGRSDSGPLPPANEVNAYCGVAYKPYRRASRHRRVIKVVARRVPCQGA